MSEPSREALNSDLCHFLDRATSPFHAVAEISAELLANGFVELGESDIWHLEAGKRYFVRRNQSSIVAWVHGAAELADSGWRILGAHTDSPNLKVKPNPDMYQHGLWRVGVEVYGGVLQHTWFDRSLSLAGRVHYLNLAGEVKHTLLDFRRAIGTVPSLAIHLNRDANSKSSINAQKHLPVLMAVGDAEKGDLKSVVLEELKQQGCEIAEVLDYELGFYDTQRAETIGINQDFIASSRLDNLLSCFIDLRSLLASAEANHWSVLVCNDHEEVGSQSSCGAAGPFLQQVLQRIAGDSEVYARAVAQSMMISTDNAHGMHPNYSDRLEPNHAPMLNAGPVIKVNANQRYASNSETQSHFRALCRQVEIPLQEFVVRSDMACGSTVGPITAAEVGIRALDVGVPTFAMHSIRELAGSGDTKHLFEALKQFYLR